VTKQVAWRLALTVMIASVLVMQYQQVRILERIAFSMADVPAKALTTSWKHNGEVVTVTTTKNIGESDAALLVRHTQEVATKLEEYPIN